MQRFRVNSSHNNFILCKGFELIYHIRTYNVKHMLRSLKTKLIIKNKTISIYEKAAGPDYTRP